MKKVFSFVVTVSLLLALPGLVALSLKATKIFTKAAGVPANIVVDTSNTIGPLPFSFRALGQGGEEQGRWLAPIIDKVRALRPRYIRIDHIYDFYRIVGRANDQLTFDFSRMDAVIDDILATGALPLISLSYMPDVISSDGSLVGLPRRWEEWQEVVGRTIAHYSGRSSKNLAGVYYEVWNEPDLFGRFTMGGTKDYGQLYKYAALGAQSQTDVNPFFFGGPALTAPIPNWLSSFLTFVEENNVRLDFLSWHRYSQDPGKFEEDSILVDRLLSEHPSLSYVQRLVTEWGPDSEVAPVNDSVEAAAFTIATIRRVMDKLTFLYTFEIKDGPSPSGEAFWGRWGLLTHEKSGIKEKPRYFALKLLDTLKGDRLAFSGEGTHDEGIATKDESGTVQLLLVNYDREKEHSEAVPVRFTNLLPGSYTYTEKDLTTPIGTSLVDVTESSFDKTILMTANTVRLIQLTPLVSQRALQAEQVLQPETNVQITLPPSPTPTPKLQLSYAPDQIRGGQAQIEISIQPQWDGNDGIERTIFRLPFTTSFGREQELAARVIMVGFAPRMVFGVFRDGQPYQTISSSIATWRAGEAHDMTFRWSKSGLSLTIDGKEVTGREAIVLENPGTLLFDQQVGIIRVRVL